MTKITMHIDLETYSPVDIKTAGAYRYAEEAEILLFGFSFDEGPVFVRDLTKETLHFHVIQCLTDPRYVKVAHNAPFEMAVLSIFYGIELDPAQWRCTAVLCSIAGYPMALGEAAKALELPVEKDTAGKALIKYFCSPCKETKVNGGRTRNLPEHDPVKWAQFIEYCRQDIVTEKAIDKKLDWIVITPEERLLWEIDYKMNCRGVGINIAMAENAVRLDAEYKERLVEEAKELTGLDNPNSVAQLGGWLVENGVVERKEKVIEPGDYGSMHVFEDGPTYESLSLTKDKVAKMLKNATDPKVKRALELRVEMSKSSVSKYKTMLTSVGKDDRIRGTLQFYGAGRTGRWAGRLIQVQNLPRISMSEESIDLARNIVIDGDLDLLDLCFDSVPDVLSQLIRSTIIPAEGNELLISDFSAIEARVIAWLADEKWRLDVFNTTGKIYEASAAQMFKVPVESITKDNPLRQKGKVAELACGYQGGPNALITMGALEGGIVPDEILDMEEGDKFDTGDANMDLLNRDEAINWYLTVNIIRPWRKASPNIVKLWYALQDAAQEAIRTGLKVPVAKGLSFSYKKGSLMMNLPSGRSLYYPKASLVQRQTPIGIKDVIVFWAVNPITKKWEESSTYGGKLAENAVQAIARDCMGNGIINLEAAKYNPVMSVHDEGVNEVPIGKGSLEKVNELMCKKAPWMGSLPLKAEGTVSPYYTK